MIVLINFENVFIVPPVLVCEGPGSSFRDAGKPKVRDITIEYLVHRNEQLLERVKTKELRSVIELMHPPLLPLEGDVPTKDMQNFMDEGNEGFHNYFVVKRCSCSCNAYYGFMYGFAVDAANRDDMEDVILGRKGDGDEDDAQTYEKPETEAGKAAGGVGK